MGVRTWIIGQKDSIESILVHDMLKKIAIRRR